MDQLKFKGFSPETFEFLTKLSKNNNKKWFDKHPKDYDDFLLEPAKAFVESMKDFLNYLNPQLVVEAKFNKSLVRINKDMRFAKKPYKEYFLIRFGKFKWDCELFLVLHGSYVSIGAFINNDKKEESRFTINVNEDFDRFVKICADYGIPKKYSITDLSDMSAPIAKYDPVKHTDTLMKIKWFTVNKDYASTNKILFSSRFVQEAIMVYNRLYPLYLYGTSTELEKDLKDYKKRVGLLKK